MLLKRIFRKLFGISRQERVGTFVLVLIVMVITVVRLSKLTYRNGSPDDTIGSTSIYEADTVSAEPGPPVRPVRFDPNRVSLDSLMMMGLSQRQAQTVLNYREAGGRFRQPEDFRKIYGIPGHIFDSLLPYIEIAPVRTAEPPTVVAERRSAPRPQVSRAEDIPPVPVPFVPVELNSADSADLERLPGIGPVLGSRIVRYRNLLGGFVSATQLGEVYGIDSLLLLRLEGMVTADTAMITRISLNSATFGELARHPYIDGDLAGRILDYRRFNGNLGSFGELVVNRIATNADIVRLRPYLSLEEPVLK